MTDAESVMNEKVRCTPPPWTALDCHNGRAAVIGPDGDHVADVYGNLAEEGDAFCNARMMAASHKMVRALNMAREFMASLPLCDLPNGTLNSIEDALAAAGVER